MKRWLAVFILLAVVAKASGEMVLPATLPDTSIDTDQTQQTPLLSGNGAWVGIVLIVVGGLFVAAACIGPIVHAEVPPMQSHDEPPGTSGHHGQMGLQEPAEHE